LGAAVALLAAVALAQNEPGPAQVRSTILGLDGGIPRVYLADTVGQQASIFSSSGGLLMTVDEKTLATLSDGCGTIGALLHGFTIEDQAVNASAVEVPLLADGGRPANVQNLVRLFVQNNSVSLKDLRCAHDNDGGAPASCTRGTALTQRAGADFPVRYPERLSCICCSPGGGATTGCTASAVVLRCSL